jgi:hypothetical protein
MATSSTATISQNLSTRQTKFTHPTFVTLSPIWNQLKDVREGTGGFIDGTYLVAHPREWLDATAATPTQPTKKLKARRTLASYENFAATIIDALKTALFREQPIRRVGDETKQATDAPPTPLEDWWENVDGAGTHLDDFMAAAWDIAGTFGHVHLYLDLPTKTPADEGSVETAADQVMPFLRVYTPLDAWDWMVDDLGALTAIKFAEIAPRQSLDTAWRPEVRVRMVDETSWRLYDQKGALVQQGEHQMGRLPVVTLFAKRRPMHPQIGASVLGDPKLYVDLYNLVSEIRELLRNQTFGILNVPLGAGENSMTLEDAKSMMTNSSGTENVLFSVYND